MYQFNVAIEPVIMCCKERHSYVLFPKSTSIPQQMYPYFPFNSVTIHTVGFQCSGYTVVGFLCSFDYELIKCPGFYCISGSLGGWIIPGTMKIVKSYTSITVIKQPPFVFFFTEVDDVQLSKHVILPFFLNDLTNAIQITDFPFKYKYFYPKC